MLACEAGKTRCGATGRTIAVSAGRKTGPHAAGYRYKRAMASLQSFSGYYQTTLLAPRSAVFISTGTIQHALAGSRMMRQAQIESSGPRRPLDRLAARRN